MKIKIGKYLAKLAFSIFFATCFCKASGAEYSYEKFCESFIGCYDFSILGKYSHEYHPYLLSKTRKSIKLLEDSLAQSFNSENGRLIIMGYEEHAIPNFFPTLKDFGGGNISDEFSKPCFSDWTRKIHNYFGIMSAFLFRSIYGNKQSTFCSVSTNGFEQFFEPRLQSYHEYCFGNYYKIINRYESTTRELLAKNNKPEILKQLLSFWKEIYLYPSFKNNCNIVVTGDILFNIENAKHLADSKIDIKKFYLGPDPTYPIEVKKKCNQRATKNAQTFLRQFISELTAVNNEPTAFIFKSFVDGVGKSTLLGNIKNYLNHGLTFDKYNSVDNSSSLSFDIFDFDNKVCIVDLPAQMSHFTFKPDGKVFVAISSAKEESSIQALFLKNHAQYLDKYEQDVILVKKILSSEDNSSDFFLNNPVHLWIKNLIILKKENENEFVSFKHLGRIYLGKKINLSKFEFKVLEKIEDAKSEGLKNADSTQMIFNDGVTLPASYDLFMRTLIEQLEKKNIKNIVFVDFLSMYSRASRENVRLNYLLQKTAEIDQNFSLAHSIYDCYLSDEHLLSRLIKPKNQIYFAQNICTEIALRQSIDYLIENETKKLAVNIIKDKDILSRTKRFIAGQDILLKNWAESLVKKKMKSEVEILKKRHKHSKDFCNLFSIDFDRVLLLSNHLQKIFSEKIDSPFFKKYFEDFPKIVRAKEIKDNVWTRNNDESFYIWGTIKKNCCNKQTLQPLISALRKNWYFLLLNLLGADKDDGLEITISNQIFHDIYSTIMVKEGDDDNLYFLSRNIKANDLTEITSFPKKIILKDFNRTNLELFELGHFSTNNFKRSNLSIKPSINNALEEYFGNHENSQKEVISISSFEKIIDPYLNHWSYILKKKLKKNADSKSNNSELKILPKHLEKPVLLLANLISTIEMVLPDLDRTIVVKNTFKHFTTFQKLFLKIILPEYFGFFVEDKIISSIFKSIPI